MRVAPCCPASEKDGEDKIMTTLKAAHDNTRLAKL